MQNGPVQDDLTIPRPCIDVATVGYNVEWSQELTLDQSLEEYVKGSMLGLKCCKRRPWHRAWRISCSI